MCHIAVSKTYAMRLSGLEITFNLFYPSALVFALAIDLEAPGPIKNILLMCALRCPVSMFDRREVFLYALSVCVHSHSAICVARINWMCEHRKWEWNQRLFSGTPLLYLYIGYLCVHTHTQSTHFRFNGYWTCAPVSFSFLKVSYFCLLTLESQIPGSLRLFFTHSITPSCSHTIIPILPRPWFIHLFPLFMKLDSMFSHLSVVWMTWRVCVYPGRAQNSFHCFRNRNTWGFTMSATNYFLLTSWNRSSHLTLL